MIVVLDTNALIQIFGQASPFAPIREALRQGRLELAVSTPILLEYEEVILRSADRARWEDVWSFLKLIDLLTAPSIASARATAFTRSRAILTMMPLPTVPSRRVRTASSPRTGISMR